MIATLLSVALLNVGITTAADGETGSTLPLPDPPEHQILDRMEWLSENRRQDLEAELERIHEEHGVDIFVVVWDRRLPDGEGPEEFAHRIGESWNRGRIWGVILLTPGSISTPHVVSGGQGVESKTSRHLKAAAVYSREFGARAWSDPDRLEQTALTLGEELIFAAQAILPSTPGQAAHTATIPPAPTRQSFLPWPIAVAIAILSFLLVVVLLLAIRLRSRTTRPGASGSAPVAAPPAPDTPPRLFPDPPATISLGGRFSSGTSMTAAVPTPSSR